MCRRALAPDAKCFQFVREASKGMAGIASDIQSLGNSPCCGVT